MAITREATLEVAYAARNSTQVLHDVLNDTRLNLSKHMDQTATQLKRLDAVLERLEDMDVNGGVRQAEGVTS